jgi:PBP1b-binding outer membrane lipoprotein LpoB
MKKSTYLLATVTALALAGCSQPAATTEGDEPVRKSAPNPWSKDVPSDAAASEAASDDSAPASEALVPKAAPPPAPEE